MTTGGTTRIGQVFSRALCNGVISPVGLVLYIYDPATGQRHSKQRTEWWVLAP